MITSFLECFRITQGWHFLVDDDTIRIDIEQYNNALDLYANNEKRIKKHIGRGLDATQYIDEGRGMELILDALGIDYSPIEEDVWGE